MNYLKLFYDTRIKAIELVGGNELYIVYDEDIARSEAKELEETYNVVFVNARCCILSCFNGEV